MADWQLEGVWLRENFGEVLWTPKIVQWRYSRETFSFSASFISFWGFFFSSPPTIKHFIHNVVPYQQFPFMVCLLMRSQAADKLDKKENEINSYWFLGKRKKKKFHLPLLSSLFMRRGLEEARFCLKRVWWSTALQMKLPYLWRRDSGLSFW